MPANVRIITPNDADTATLTAAPAMLASLPVTNLQDQTRARVARTDGLPATQTIYGNWPAPKPISAFAIVRHNLSAAATVRFRAWDGEDQTGTLLRDSGAVQLGEDIPGYGEFAYGMVPYGASVFSDWPVAFYSYWFDVVIARSFQIDITDVGTVAGYMEASRLFVGKYFEPLVNFNWNGDCHWEEDSTQERTGGGTLRTDAKPPYRVWQFNLDYLTSGERATLMQICRQIGLRNDLFISMYPEVGGEMERDHAGQVKLARMPPHPNSFANNWRTELLFKET